MIFATVVSILLILTRLGFTIFGAISYFDDPTVTKDEPSCNQSRPLISNATNIWYDPREQRSACHEITQSVMKHILRQPYHASIYYASGHVCSGALVSERWVLTSASCMEYRNGWPEIRLGVNNNTINETEQM